MTQLEWDMGRVDRSAERLDEQLSRHEISPVQRAVIWFLVVFDDPNKPAEDVEHDKDLRTRTVRTTYEDASDWCLTFAPMVRGMKLGRSAVCKAVQEWIERGVVFRQSGRTRTRLVLSVDRLRKWFASLGDPFEPALFSALPRVDERFQALPDVSERFPTFPSVSERCQALPSVSPQFNESINEESSFIREEEPQKATAQTGSEPAPATPTEIGRLLSGLPNLPDEVWDSKSDAATWSIVSSWWQKHRLADRFGPQAESVGATLIGLIEAARKARDQAAFFYKARSKPAHYLEGNGRKWLKRVAASRPTTDPIVEATARERARLREERAAVSAT